MNKTFALLTSVIFTICVGVLSGNFLSYIGLNMFMVGLVQFLIGWTLPGVIFKWIYSEDPKEE